MSRKDAFPGADGSTITQGNYPNSNAATIPIYGADGETKLVENETGYKIVNITAAGVLNNNNSQIYAIKNPLSFVYNLNEPWDWYTNTGNHNDALWNGDLSTKSNYDPCPKEWRVPTDATWNDFSTITAPFYINATQSSSGSYYETNGRLYSNSSWYPANGYRRITSGILTRVGAVIDIWASSYKDAYGISLYSTMNSVNIGNGNRACGLSVRCVQE